MGCIREGLSHFIFPSIEFMDWEFPSCERLIVIGDLHGDLQRLTQCFYSAHLINHDFQWIAEPKNTWVIQLGDQVDSLSRGSNDDWESMPDIHVIQFMDQMDALARPHGGRVISLLGNHEIMNAMGDFTYVSKKSIEGSGGLQARANKFKPGGTIAQTLSKRPVVVKIGELLFCHAGLLPQHLYVAGNLSKINEWARRYMRYEPFQPDEAKRMQMVLLGSEGILWNRHYSETSDDERLNYLNLTLSMTKCRSMFIGHTTVPEILALYDLKLWFVDNGISRAFDLPKVQILEILDGGVPSEKNNFVPFRTIIIDKK